MAYTANNASGGSYMQKLYNGLGKKVAAGLAALTAAGAVGAPVAANAQSLEGLASDKPVAAFYETIDVKAVPTFSREALVKLADDWLATPAGRSYLLQQEIASATYSGRPGNNGLSTKQKVVLGAVLVTTGAYVASQAGGSGDKGGDSRTQL